MATTAICGIAFAVLTFSASKGGAFTLNDSVAKFPPNVQLIAVGGQSTLANLTVDIFSISSNNHRDGAELPHSPDGFSSTMLDGTIYVVGNTGTTNSTANNFFAYNVSANNWTQLRNHPYYYLYRSVAVAVNGAVYTVPGDATENGALNNTYKYEVSADKWTKIPTKAPYEDTTYACAVATSSGSIFLLPGTGGLFRSDDGAQSWKKMSRGSPDRICVSCAWVSQSDSILVAGGAHFTSNEMVTDNSADLYDIATDTWKSVTPMKKARFDASAVAVPGTDDVIVCGGKDSFYNDHSAVYSDCELYDTSANDWKVMDVEMNMPRFGFGLFASQGLDSF